MDVIDRLSTVLIAVHHYAETFFATQLFSQALGGEQNMSGEWFVFFRQVVEGADRFFRDDQKMHRCLRGYVVKRQHLIIFVDDLGGYLAVDDLGEQSIQCCISVVEVSPECTQQVVGRPVGLARTVGFVDGGGDFSRHPT